MQTALKLRIHALLCALFCAAILPIVTILINAHAEIGIVDDWSYVKTVHVLAQTGHIAYNGWSAPIVGWLMFWGAGFVKLFGFSYSVVRWSGITVSMATAFLVQRTFVRAGVNERNATLGTATLVLSSIYLPMSLLFMTDIGGLLALIVCLYACIRSIEASCSQSHALLWFAFAAFSNALLGSVRQVGWLGVLVMVPSTLFVLRKRWSRASLLVGAGCWLVGCGIVYLILHWYARQPYSVPEQIIPPGVRLMTALRHIVGGFFIRSTLQLLFLLSPILLMFTFAAGRRGLRVFLGAVLISLFPLLAVSVRTGQLDGLFPWELHTITPVGFTILPTLQGAPPTVLSLGVRIILTLVTVGSAAGLYLLCSDAYSQRKRLAGHEGTATSLQPAANAPSYLDLATLIVPCSLAYICLLFPRIAKTGVLLDRYLLFLLAISLLGILLAYQRLVAPRLPAVCIVLILLSGSLIVAGAHDMFSTARGRLAAIDQMLARGVPATQIDGTAEFNAATEIEETGYLHDANIRVPAGLIAPKATEDSRPCAPYLGFLMPSVQPHYGLSYSANLCEGPAGFAPVTYKTWLPPYTVVIYTVGYQH